MTRPVWKLVSDSIFYEHFILENEKVCSGPFQGKSAITFKLSISNINHKNIRGMMGSFWTGVNYIVSENELNKCVKWGSYPFLASLGCVQTANLKKKYDSLTSFYASENKKGMYMHCAKGTESVHLLKGGLSGDIHFIIYNPISEDILETIKETKFYACISLIQTAHRFSND